jgi:hypothetical protein
MNKFEELKELLLRIDSSGDITKFYDRNNNTAATRIRLNMQEIKTAAQAVRDEISEIRVVRKSTKIKKAKKI